MLRATGHARMVARRCLACRAQRGPLGVLPKAKRPRGNIFWSQHETTRMVSRVSPRRAATRLFRHKFAKPVLSDVVRQFKIAGGCARRTKPVYLCCSNQSPSRAPRAACVSTWLGEYLCAHAAQNSDGRLAHERVASRQGARSTSHLPDVVALFHVGAAAAAPRASRAGLPLCGSGPDNVWQRATGLCRLIDG